MHVAQVSKLDELLAYKDRWDELAGGCVFRKWAWQSKWWKHYGDDRTLSVLLLFDAGDATCEPCRLIAILPCYVETSLARGKVVRLLGDGEVCSDHLDLLTEPENIDKAANSFARFLVEQASQWDATEFTAIGADCTGLFAFSESLKSLDCQVSQDPNESRWAVSLPEDWEAFLALQSKSHRKQLRRLERRVLDSDDATWHLVESPEQFEQAWPILIDLHQRRRRSLGEPGCFASQRWADFHRDIARQLLDSGELRLSWLELAGQPIAAEYHFASDRATFAYQGGVDPDRLDDEPGRLSTIRTLQNAIAEGHQAFDLMRGDEPYKAHWRAQPTETFDLRIVPARGTALLRNQAYDYLQNAVRLTRQFTNVLC